MVHAQSSSRFKFALNLDTSNSHASLGSTCDAIVYSAVPHTAWVHANQNCLPFENTARFLSKLVWWSAALSGCELCVFTRSRLCQTFHRSRLCSSMCREYSANYRRVSPVNGHRRWSLTSDFKWFLADLTFNAELNVELNKRFLCYPVQPIVTQLSLPTKSHRWPISFTKPSRLLNHLQLHR